MSYRALLFCADEKTVRAVNQILHELEFSVEACSEPFSAVKQLTATHFDALLVDCENEQNATLLFKSARNSEFNHASLSVGLVEGQAAIAKAFRIGANLILSKPINLEQAKSTLRVARGLLRKAEAAKAMAQPTPEPALQAAPELALQTALESATPDVTEADSAPAESAPSPAPIALSAAASVGGIEIEEKEPAPKLGAAEAALLESLPEPIVPALGENTTRLLAAESASAQVATPSQDPVPAPAASQSFSVTDNKVEPESAATPEPAKESAPSVAASPSSAAGAATAPAKETPKQAAEPPALSAPASAPKSSAPAAKSAKRQVPALKKGAAKPASKSATSGSSWASDDDQPASGDSESKKNFVIAAVLVCGLAAGVYFAWPRLEPLLKNVPILQNYIGRQAPTAPNRIAPAARVPEPPAQSSAAPTPANATTQPAETGGPQTSATQPSPAGETQPTPTTSPVAKTGTEGLSAENRAAQAGTKAPMLVKSGPSAKASDAATPPSVGIAAGATDNPVSGLGKPPLQILHVSQGVSDAMLVKKVAPAYPTLAQQMRVQGPVQLQANINKDGSVTNLKVVRGDSMLAPAALAAVRQWKYKPYRLDGQAVEIQTDITVNFKLPE